jgi:hypothetical protein
VAPAGHLFPQWRRQRNSGGKAKFFFQFLEARKDIIKRYYSGISFHEKGSLFSIEIQ